MINNKSLLSIFLSTMTIGGCNMANKDIIPDQIRFGDMESTSNYILEKRNLDIISIYKDDELDGDIVKDVTVFYKSSQNPPEPPDPLKPLKKKLFHPLSTFICAINLIIKSSRIKQVIVINSILTQINMKIAPSKLKDFIKKKSFGFQQTIQMFHKMVMLSKAAINMTI